MLKHTSDLMHTGDAVPLKPLGTKMSDALVEMSAKGFGCVAIVDARGLIAGIITDGDLRRQMRPDLMTALVDDIMTTNPKTIARDSLASEALELLNSAEDHHADRDRGGQAGRHHPSARPAAGGRGVSLSASFRGASATRARNP